MATIKEDMGILVRIPLYGNNFLMRLVRVFGVPTKKLCIVVLHNMLKVADLSYMGS